MLQSDKLQQKLNMIALEMKKWDADRKRISHKEDHEGGAFAEWHASDDWAVSIVRSLQEILGEQAQSEPMKLCPPGQECVDCSAVGQSYTS